MEDKKQLKQELIEEIRNIYRDLLEEKGKCLPNGVRDWPDNTRYADLAMSLYSKAISLEKIDSSYSCYTLSHVMGDGVKDIAEYKFDYDTKTQKVTTKSRDGLQKLIIKTNKDIRRQFFSVLEECS